MKSLAAAALVAGVALSGASGADAAVIKTNWNERIDYANRPGFVRLYVRKIQVTRAGWKAWVGLTNNSSMTVGISARLERPFPATPFTYWAGPGLWWSSYQKGGSWWPGSGTILTHAIRGDVTPRYPATLRPQKSWFGTFSGAASKLPRGRLLRVGFGILDYPQRGVFDPNGRPLRREILLSTTHQLKLPRTLS